MVENNQNPKQRRIETIQKQIEEQDELIQGYQKEAANTSDVHDWDNQQRLLDNARNKKAALKKKLVDLEQSQKGQSKKKAAVKKEPIESGDKEREGRIEQMRRLINASRYRNFWWINANPDHWKIKDLGIGKTHSYSTHTSDGNKRGKFENFFLAKKGDLALGYETNPTQRILSIFEIIMPSEKKEGDNFIFKLIYLFEEQTSYGTIKDLKEVKKRKSLNNMQGSILHISYNEFKAIANTTELNPIKDREKDDLPSYTDNPELEDKLGREPIARSVVAVIKNIWPDSKNVSRKYGRSFMVHVQGPWGSGKSTFLNLIEKELKKDKWVVVKYNAWRHQHIDPPWWSLLDSVFKQARLQIPCADELEITELFRRLRSGSFWMNLLAGILLVLTITVPFVIIPDYMGLKNPLIEEISKIITLVGGIIALFASIHKSLNQSLLAGSSTSAKTFARMARDPMKRINKHFKGIIKYTERPVAIFIDDLDRCEPKFTVQLLEGIQTLFRDTQVLYVVAADKNWIAKSFEIHYERFTDTISQKGTRLGYLFIQKAFQLSVRMPKLTDQKIQQFWNYLLKIKKDSTDEVTKEAQKKFASADSTEDVKYTAKILEADGKIPEQVIRLAAVNKLNEQKFIASTENELQRFSMYMEPNPRAMKRLANFYNVFDRTLILEGRELDISVKVRWLLLSQRWPILADELEKYPRVIESLEDYNGSKRQDIEKILQLEDVQQLLAGKNGDKPLTTQDIKDCIGWENISDEFEENISTPN